MKLFHDLWTDEAGAVLSAEVVTVGTVAVLGTITGLSVAANAVDGELKDFAYAIRSLDQSYHIEGHKACGAYTAGSHFQQRDVQESIQALCAEPDTTLPRKTEESPTPVITPDSQPAKENQLPAPVKKPGKKKPGSAQRDVDETDENSQRPPQVRTDADV